MLDIYNLDQQLSELPVKDGQMLLIPRYEGLQDSEEKSRLWKRIQEQGRREKYVFASRLPFAARSFWHTRFRSSTHLWEKRIETGKGRSRQLFLQKRIHLYPEELARIEHDF